MSAGAAPRDGAELAALPVHPAGVAWPTEEWPTADPPAGWDLDAWLEGDCLGTWWASGYGGQTVTVRPGLDTVVVRSGRTPEGSDGVARWRRTLLARMAGGLADGVGGVTTGGGAGEGGDLDWLGLRPSGPDRWSLPLAEGLTRLDHKFYGGTGIAASAALMEVATGRPVRWVTAQYASSADVGDVLECRVAVVASGRRSAQVQVSGWYGERLVWTALGATGTGRPADVEASWGTMPEVPAPEDCPRWAPRAFLVADDDRPGWLSVADARAAGDGSAMWLRLEGRPLTRAAMAFLADVIPAGVLRAAGHLGGGTSLDNTLRWGPEPDGEWLLVDVDPHLVADGYIQGSARLWSRSGRLLGVASQTATMVIMGRLEGS